MKKTAKKYLKGLLFLFLTYPYGLIAGAFFHLLRKLRLIKVWYWERFPHWQGKLVLVSNHPSMLETLLLPLLFFREYFFHPFKFGPWSTPDKENFADSWHWFWIKPRIIPIFRGNKWSEGRAFIKMKEVINSGGIVILFPEGGRTYRGEEFLYSKKGERIRILKNGIGRLILETGATVLPVWVEGSEKIMPNSPKRLFTFPRFWKKLIIKIGKPIILQGFDGDREEATKIIADNLLILADE